MMIDANFSLEAQGLLWCEGAVVHQMDVGIRYGHEPAGCDGCNICIGHLERAQAGIAGSSPVSIQHGGEGA